MTTSRRALSMHNNNVGSPALDHSKPRNNVYTGTDSYSPDLRTNPACRPHGSRTWRAPIAPSRDVVDATEFLLAQPDAYLYRHRYLELVTYIPGPDGTLAPDYAAAETYLLTTATAVRRKTAPPKLHRRRSTVHSDKTDMIYRLVTSLMPTRR